MALVRGKNFRFSKAKAQNACRNRALVVLERSPMAFPVVVGKRIQERVGKGLLNRGRGVSREETVGLAGWSLALGGPFVESGFNDVLFELHCFSFYWVRSASFQRVALAWWK